MVVQFACVPDKTYAVEYADDLASWNLLTAPVLTFPAPGLCQWIDDGSQTGGLPASVRIGGWEILGRFCCGCEWSALRRNRAIEPF